MRRVEHSMMKRFSTVLLAAAFLVVGAGTSQAETVKPSKGTHSFATKDALVQVLDGPTDTHAATIDTRLYVPDNATAAHPQPAILMTHGFGLTKLSGEVTASAIFLAKHGYVVLTYTSEGFGKSTGCVTLQSRTYDVKVAKQLITKVLQAPFVKKDGKGPIVGMTGGSYGGGIQANVAESDPRVRGINPGRTWNDLRYSLDPNNYVAPGDATGFTHSLNQQGVFKLNWTSLFFASGTGNPLGGVPPTGEPAGTCPQDKLTAGEVADIPGVACAGFYLAVCQTYATVAATGDASDADRALFADSSATTAIANLKVPVLLFQGQADTLFNVNDATATYLQLKKQGTPVQMVWNSGGHGGYDSLPGECDVYGRGTTGLDDCYLSLRTLQFFDHWLLGKPDTSPGFSFFRDWAPYSGKGATTQYGDAKAFPLPGTKTFTLSGTSALVTGSVTGTTSNQVVNPPGGVPSAVTEVSNFTGPDASPNAAPPVTELPGQHVDFTTAPFANAVDSVGVPSMRLQLSHVAPTDLVLFGKVYDVAPDGSATLIHRLIAPSRIPSSALSKPVDLKLVGFAHRFAKGHSARLTLATTDLTSYNNKVADVLTVVAGNASTFTLPYSLVPNAVSRPVVVTPAPAVPPRTLPSTGLDLELPLLAAGLLAAALVRRRV